MNVFIGFGYSSFESSVHTIPYFAENPTLVRIVTSFVCSSVVVSAARKKSITSIFHCILILPP
jgi:hypothetical protein